MSPSVSDEYAAAIQFLYRRINYEQTPPEGYRRRKLNLDQMRLLLDRIGNPHAKLPVVHIAGTKGKGSTAAMISAALSCAGYRTGLYTSPHLSCLEERFVVDGVRCSPTELVALTDAIRPSVTAVDQEVQAVSSMNGLTFFEVTTAMAWMFFVCKEVDIAVVEVGLGGRLDSTNLCRPLATVITSISFDHTKQLGYTLAAIAREKAGIIKSGIPVVSGVVPTEARDVVRKIARDRESPLYELGNEFEVVNLVQQRHGLPLYFDYRGLVDGSERRLDGIQIGLLGRHQAVNASLAVAALACLDRHTLPFDENMIRKGLARARCPARIELVRRDPIVILDTAHNDASIAALIETLNENFPRGRRVLVFAVSRDKDVRGMLGQLIPHFDAVILTQYVNNPRALPIGELERVAQDLVATSDPPARTSLAICPTPVDAWRKCQTLLQPADLACVTGSFFLAAELQPLLGLRS